ncbi:MAG: histidine kinase dimerization/phospho-acceptor domain-containing protein [Polyangia bacterium]
MLDLSGPSGPLGVSSELSVLLRQINAYELFRNADLIIWTDQLPQGELPEDLVLPDTTAWLPRQLGPGALLRFVRSALSRRRAEAALAAELHRCSFELAAAHERFEQSPHYQNKFLAAMSHELRTPLNAIIGFSELLQQELFGPLNPRQQQYVGNVLQSGHHLLKLVNDTLELSKVEAGRLTLRRSWISASMLLDLASAPARGLASRRQVNLSLTIASDVPALYLDPEQIRQAIERLLLGAIERTQAGGTVRLRIAAPDGQLSIQVQDGADGSEALSARRVPKDMARLPGPSEAGNPKISVDLALAQRLVEMHGGHIVLEGRPGQGSLYTVSLPLPRASDARPAGSGLPESLDPTRVLLVEDDGAAGLALEAQLSRLGLSVAIATTAAEALRLASELRPGLLLLDIMLPDADGWAVLGQLRNNPQTAAMDVIVTSVLDEPERSHELGVWAYLTKPVCPITLLDAMSECGMRICSIDGLRLVVIGPPDAHLIKIVEHLKSAGCEVEQVMPTAQVLGGRADLAVLDGTGRARRTYDEGLLDALRRDGTPCLWLLDGDTRPPGSPSDGCRSALALADALCLPVLVQAVYAASAIPSKEQGV